MRNSVAIQKLGKVARSLMRGMSNNEDVFHERIVASGLLSRNAWRRATLSVLVTLFIAPAFAVEKVALHALFKDKAIIVIDGKRRVLDKGATSPEGILLIATDTVNEEAEIEVEGKRQSIKLGMVASSKAATGKGTITLYPDRGGHYFADGLINGVGVRFLVDTGATTVTMGAATARRVGIDYRTKGARGYSQTAGGVVSKYSVKLDSVQVGESILYNVDGGVIEGMPIDDVLLGMSFLSRFDMKRDNEKMELIQRY